MEKIVVQAKIDLMLHNPFWGSLASRLQLKEWEGDTFATDGKYILVPDIKYFKSWTFAEVKGVIAHEVWHCAGGHIFRMGGKNQLKWNVASDFATNWLLTQNGFKLPNGCLLDQKYAAMSAEKIYALLPDSPNKIPMDMIDPGKGKGQDGKTNADPKEMEQDWKEAITNAVKVAQGRGNMPAGLEEWIDANLFPKVPWQQILYRYLQSAKGNTDYTAYPFNRRHIYREIYLPSMQGEMIELCVAVDTSGSISGEDLKRYFSEVRGICSIFGSYVIHFLECDAQVHGDEQIITEDSDTPNVAMGRGGTDFRPVFSKIEELGLQDLPTVYFTDLDGSFPDRHEGDGVFWMVRRSQLRKGATVPFGTIVEIED